MRSIFYILYSKEPIVNSFQVVIEIFCYFYLVVPVLNTGYQLFKVCLTFEMNENAGVNSIDDFLAELFDTAFTVFWNKFIISSFNTIDSFTYFRSYIWCEFLNSIRQISKPVCNTLCDILPHTQFSSFLICIHHSIRSILIQLIIELLSYVFICWQVLFFILLCFFKHNIYFLQLFNFKLFWTSWHLTCILK